MSLVWERAPYAEGSLLVLLALADWADDNGVAWPSVDGLAHKARLQRRRVQYIIRKLKGEGFLDIEEGGGRRKRHRYSLNLTKLNGALNAPFIETNSALEDKETVHFGAERVHSETQTVHSSAPDPLEEPLQEPSVKKPSAVDARGARIPKDFSLTDSMREWGAQETPHVDLGDALKEFVDYWSDIAGKAGVKLSWDGTWRNRMRELEKRATKNGNGRSPKFDPARNSEEPTAPRPQLPAPTVTVEELASLNITG